MLGPGFFSERWQCRLSKFCKQWMEIVNLSASAYGILLSDWLKYRWYQSCLIGFNFIQYRLIS